MKDLKRFSCAGNIHRIGKYPTEVRKILIKYPQAKAQNLIPILRDVQDKFGYLSRDNLVVISNYLNLPFSRVLSVASIYNQFKLKPIGKNIIRVCRGTACHINGSEKILEHLKSELNLKNGDTTDDMKFTLESVGCLGMCSIAPVVSINNKFYGRLTTQDVDALISKLN